MLEGVKYHKVYFYACREKQTKWLLLININMKGNWTEIILITIHNKQQQSTVCLLPYFMNAGHICSETITENRHTHTHNDSMSTFSLMKYGKLINPSTIANISTIFSFKGVIHYSV